MAKHPFSFNELNTILSEVVDRTLGEVDVNDVFARTIDKPKITGIAGDVIEQSVLGYPSDSDSEPDLIVDGVPTELKTTGIRVKTPKGKGKPEYKAKEPMSITAVSINKIVKEDNFYDSRFWHKLERLLLVYYNYASPKAVPAAEYANFVIEGYQFHEFSKEDEEILKNDWTVVRDFIRDLQATYPDPTTEYPRISSELRKQLMLIDTAPKYPNPPRFRLKQSTVTTMVQKHFGAKLEKLDNTYSSFKKLEDKLHQLTEQYKGKTVRQLIEELNIKASYNKDTGDVPKGISEQIIVKMLGGKAKKLSKIELFSKVGIIPKTIVMTSKGTRTEDTKLFKIDFDEWTREYYEAEVIKDGEKHNELRPMVFEESFIYNYFMSHQFLCIVFKEPSTTAPLLDNEFVGFKRLAFDETLVNEQIKELWENIRYLILNNKLKEKIKKDKYGQPIINKKTKTIKTSINFPKSKDYDVFVRGSGTDANFKPVQLNGINMYAQYIWIKGSVLIGLLQDIDYI